MANEYSVNSADLLAVANAIRAKAESTDGLVFPAGFVEAISGIETGGGMFYACGSITPSAATSTITVTHELGVVPKYIMFALDYLKLSQSINVMRQVIVLDSSVFEDLKDDVLQFVYHDSDTTAYFNNGSENYVYRLLKSNDEKSFVLEVHSEISSVVKFAAKKYNWVAIA